MEAYKTTILFHVYYDNIPQLSNYFFKKNYGINNKFLFNVCSENTAPSSIAHSLKINFSNSYITLSGNQGKDVGGKLALIDLYLKTNQKSDYILLLHDKKSPQVLFGEKWKSDLMKIAEEENINKTIEIFANNPDVGIVCSSQCISNEYDEIKDEFRTTNNLILKDYIKKFDFKLTDYSFVAGNMFWVRSCIYEKFFKIFNPLELRSELEKGNVMDNEIGTKTHSMERVFSWIATNQGYKIVGI